VGALEKKKKGLELKGEQEVAEAKQVAEKLDGMKVVIHAKVGTGTKLYGSVTSQEIVEALSKQHHIKLDKRKLHITDPIKSTGTFDVPAKLHHEVTAKIHVEVLGKEE
jgi:large subunit ribosomal protein L9